MTTLPHTVKQLSEKYRTALSLTHLTKYFTQHTVPDPAGLPPVVFWLYLFGHMPFSTYVTSKGPSNTMSPYWGSISDVNLQVTGFEEPK